MVALQVSMQHDLAELYYKLKYFEHAQRVLTASLGRRKEEEDPNTMMLDVKVCIQPAASGTHSYSHTTSD